MTTLTPTRAKTMSKPGKMRRMTRRKSKDLLERSDDDEDEAGDDECDGANSREEYVTTGDPDRDSTEQAPSSGMTDAHGDSGDGGSAPATAVEVATIATAVQQLTMCVAGL
ncbi:uncharacterized protein IUM83_18820 [Phytophthora cinnamomi]|uniref:uncharacterized protein n=1 Tax=Phytophthora cinnamomi TaxID=4785 RepID=UPI003559863D|nr:hypothetical protein IUM83_18820 [Phytophthora cinnamomi]